MTSAVVWMWNVSHRLMCFNTYTLLVVKLGKIMESLVGGSCWSKSLGEECKVYFYVIFKIYSLRISYTHPMYFEHVYPSLTPSNSCLFTFQFPCLPPKSFPPPPECKPLNLFSGAYKCVDTRWFTRTWETNQGPHTQRKPALAFTCSLC